MPLTVTHNAPTESSYIPVAEFQSTTPESFTTSVLHSLHRNCRIAVSSKQAALIPALRAASTETTEPSASEENITIEGLEIWVTSEFVFPPEVYEHLTSNNVGSTQKHDHLEPHHLNGH